LKIDKTNFSPRRENVYSVMCLLEEYENTGEVQMWKV
jgi:hypothetical protein